MIRENYDNFLIMVMPLPVSLGGRGGAPCLGSTEGGIGNMCDPLGLQGHNHPL